jgi:hypothetical protein
MASHTKRTQTQAARFNLVTARDVAIRGARGFQLSSKSWSKWEIFGQNSWSRNYKIKYKKLRKY